MHRFILTGAPGAGKTTILRMLETRGHWVVEEAATDVIALASAQGRSMPHLEPRFIDDIVGLQRLRQIRSDAAPTQAVIFDRSPICTWALAEFLGIPPSDLLRREVDRAVGESLYERRVFFIQNQGFVSATDARRISFEDSLRFEDVHAAVYDRFGFERVIIAPGPVEARAMMIEQHLV